MPWDKSIEIDRGIVEGKHVFTGKWFERGYIDEETGEKLEPSYASGYLVDKYGNTVKDPDY
jgi:hypothetical protein